MAEKDEERKTATYLSVTFKRGKKEKNSKYWKRWEEKSLEFGGGSNTAAFEGGMWAGKMKWEDRSPFKWHGNKRDLDRKNKAKNKSAKSRKKKKLWIKKKGKTSVVFEPIYSGRQNIF